MSEKSRGKIREQLVAELAAPAKRKLKPHQIIVLMGPDLSVRRDAAKIIYQNITECRVRNVCHVFDSIVRAALSLIGDEYKREDYAKDFPGLFKTFADLYGESWLGNSLLRDMKRPHNMDATVFPDVDSLDDIRPLVEHYGSKHAHVIDIQPSGTSVGPQYVLRSGILVNYQVLVNRHDHAMFRAMILRRVDAILGIEGREYKL